jgi:hypothetical protein
MKLGVMAFNCSHGSTITTCPRSVEAQPERHRARLTDLIDDRRFAETIYRVALADGIMDCVTYQDPPEGAS